MQVTAVCVTLMHGTAVCVMGVRVTGVRATFPLALLPPKADYAAVYHDTEYGRTTGLN